MNIRLTICGFLAVAGWLWLLAEGIIAAPRAEVPQEVEEALLAEDWQTVIIKCGPNERLVSNPVLRAINGHAYLAANDNNNSLKLFLSLAGETDRETWHDWTARFARRNERSAVAQYFLGDAAARVGDWRSAISTYTRAVEADREFVMAWNACGVAYAELAALTKDEEQRKELFDVALKSIETACEKGPQLADAWASRGTLMLANQLADEAYLSFDTALERSPQFALALNGRGCAWYGRIGPRFKSAWENTNRDFAQAGRRLPLPIVVWNLRALGLSAENTAMPDLVDSPLFRLTDFLDWDALREATRNQGDIFRTLLGRELPEEESPAVIAELNRRR